MPPHFADVPGIGAVEVDAARDFADDNPVSRLEGRQNISDHRRGPLLSLRPPPCFYALDGILGFGMLDHVFQDAGQYLVRSGIFRVVSNRHVGRDSAIGEPQLA